MRRRLSWVMVLLVVAALAVPAAAAGKAAGTGGIHGVIKDALTGGEFDTSGGAYLGVDVFNVATGDRSRRFISGTSEGDYSFTDLAPGYYKLRVRGWDASSHLTHYRWYSNRATYDAATQIHVIAGASVAINVKVSPMAGASVSGTLTEKGSGLPLETWCYSVWLYEASGIALGWIPFAETGGAYTVTEVPAGRWAALAVYNTGLMDTDGDGTDDLDCGTGPAHMDTWFKGPAGWPLAHGNMVADAGTFPAARTFTVTAGVDVTGIDIAMLPAPTCRGKVPTIFGTTLADTIDGTAGRDIISGLAGNDTITGKGGNDLLCGDAGDDTITGGIGTDTAVGGGGTDTCSAENRVGCEITP